MTQDEREDTVESYSLASIKRQRSKELRLYHGQLIQVLTNGWMGFSGIEVGIRIHWLNCQYSIGKEIYK